MIGQNPADGLELFRADVLPAPGAESRFATVNGVKLHYLTTWWDALEVAEEGKYFDANTLREVRAFLTEPSKWSAAHGGISDFAAPR